MIYGMPDEREDRKRYVYENFISVLKKGYKNNKFGDYDICFYMKVPDGKDALLYKERVVGSDCFEISDENTRWDIL